MEKTTMFQQVIESNPQSAMGFAMPEQDGLAFPQSLTEKYQPNRIENFVGLARPKQFLSGLLKSPRSCSALFIGPPGSGKTTMALAFAQQLGGSLKHLAAQKTDVAALDTLRDQLAYSPIGGWWVVLIDEIDGMTDKAQLQMLSRLDGTASLKPKFGGGFERGTPPPIIYLMTCNGRGPKETDPPTSLLPRFLSRSMIVEFEAATDADMATYLEQVWANEGGEPASAAYFEFMAKGVGVRDALNRLQTDLLAGPRPVPDPEPEPEQEEQLPRRPAKPARPRATHTVVCIDRDKMSPAQKAWQTRRANMRVAAGE
jgi:hypothetical protein